MASFFKRALGYPKASQGDIESNDLEQDYPMAGHNHSAHTQHDSSESHLFGQPTGHTVSPLMRTNANSETSFSAIGLIDRGTASPCRTGNELVADQTTTYTLQQAVLIPPTEPGLQELRPKDSRRSFNFAFPQPEAQREGTSKLRRLDIKEPHVSRS